MDCNICCEFIKKPLTCGFCDFGACVQCTERYLLETHDDAHCMNCRKAWDQDFLCKVLTQNFLTKRYRTRRKEILLDREKSLLPNTQPDVERELADRARKKLLADLVAERQELKERIQELTRAINDINYNDAYERSESSGSVTTRKCPVNDCRGFLNNHWKCGICETHICKDCNEPKDDEHVCDPNNVETIKLLKNDSKPCPSCGTIITKIDGCDQMWCTQPSCHTAFSWRTGKKVFGVIHNPHYIQFSMTNGVAERNPQDVPCGGLPEIYTFFSRVRSIVKLCYHDKFSDPFRGIRHMIQVEEPYYRVADVVNTNTDLRVRYLLKEIDDDCMARTIIQRETARKKKKAFHDIIVMVTHTGTDVINVINDVVKSNVREAFNQIEILEKLREYANQQFARVGMMYKCKYPCICRDWTFNRYI